MPNAHVTEHDLEAYSLGRIDFAAGEPVEEHLLICDECRSRLTEWDEYCGAIRAAGRLVKAPGAARRAIPQVRSASSE